MSEPDRHPEPLLELRDVVSRRGRLEVLHGVSLTLGDELVAVFGLNASGKSTLLRTVSGLTPAVGGSIRFDGKEIGGLSAHSVARRGVGFMPQDKQVFPTLDVVENIRVAGRLVPSRELDSEVERVLDYVPALKDRREAKARHLSGGQRQMLALAMALVRRPRALLLDEPSAGLAPTTISSIYEILGRLREERMPILMAEQNLHRALEVADRALVLVLGRNAGGLVVTNPEEALAQIKELMIGTTIRAHEQRQLR
jgi:branched-chain amino acid transport system ATP-binding protein